MLAVDHPGMRSVKSMVAAVPFTVLDSEPGVFGIYAWGDVVVVVWRTQGTGALAERFRVVAERELASRDGKFSSVHLLAPDTPLPTAEARAILAGLITRHAGRCSCVAVVLGGGGFWASALRSIVLGMRMLAPRSLPLDFQFDLESAARFVCKHHLDRAHVPLDFAQLCAALEQVAEQSLLNFKRRSLPPRRTRG